MGAATLSPTGSILISNNTGAITSWWTSWAGIRDARSRIVEQVLEFIAPEQGLSTKLKHVLELTTDMPPNRHWVRNRTMHRIVKLGSNRRRAHGSSWSPSPSRFGATTTPNPWGRVHRGVRARPLLDVCWSNFAAGRAPRRSQRLGPSGGSPTPLGRRLSQPAPALQPPWAHPPVHRRHHRGRCGTCGDRGRRPRPFGLRAWRASPPRCGHRGQHRYR